MGYVDHIETASEALFAHALSIGLEGVVGKRADSHYVGGRTRDWLKAKPAGYHGRLGATAPTESRRCVANAAPAPAAGAFSEHRQFILLRWCSTSGGNSFPLKYCGEHTALVSLIAELNCNHRARRHFDIR